MNAGTRTATAIQVRRLQPSDLDDVVRIDALHTGERKAGYWQGVFRDFLGRSPRRPDVVGLVAESQGITLGYLLGEVRAFEFGSDPCGWVFALGVEPGRRRDRVASRLMDEACRRFAAAGMTRVRTMVQRNNVPVLSFFRASGFVAGSFVQLELDLAERADMEDNR